MGKIISPEAETRVSLQAKEQQGLLATTRTQKEANKQTKKSFPRAFSESKH